MPARQAEARHAWAWQQAGPRPGCWGGSTLRASTLRASARPPLACLACCVRSRSSPSAGGGAERSIHALHGRPGPMVLQAAMAARTAVGGWGDGDGGSACKACMLSARGSGSERPACTQASRQLLPAPPRAVSLQARRRLAAVAAGGRGRVSVRCAAALHHLPRHPGSALSRVDASCTPLYRHGAACVAWAAKMLHFMAAGAKSSRLSRAGRRGGGGGGGGGAMGRAAASGGCARPGRRWAMAGCRTYWPAL